MLKHVLAFVAFFAISLSSGATTVATQEDVKSISRLYSAAFDRSPGFSGLNFWISSFEAGRSIRSIAGDFQASPEFVNKYGELDNLDYVLQLYRNVLSREGEDDGVNFWWGRLESGEITREGVLERFSDSPENKLKTENIFKYLRKYPDGSWDLYSSYLDGDSIEDYSNLDFDTIQAPSQLVIGVVNLMNSMLIVRPELRDSLFSNDEFSERVAVQTYFSSLDDNDYVSYAVLTVSTLKKQYPHDVAPSSTPYAVSYIEYDNNDIEINFAKLRSLWGCSRDYSHPTARCVQFSIGEANGAYSSGSVNLVPVTMGDFTWFEAK